jgi:hypothetical protein
MDFSEGPVSNRACQPENPCISYFRRAQAGMRRRARPESNLARCASLPGYPLCRSGRLDPPRHYRRRRNPLETSGTSPPHGVVGRFAPTAERRSPKATMFRRSLVRARPTADRLSGRLSLVVMWLPPPWPRTDHHNLSLLIYACSHAPAPIAHGGSAPPIDQERAGSRRSSPTAA